MGSECKNIRTYEAVLVLAFTKGSERTGMFSTRMFHTDVEIQLIKSPPPVIPSPGMEGTDQYFDSWQLLGIHIDRIKGVHSYTTQTTKISSSKHNVLCIPLTSGEYKAVIEFLHEIRGLPYNHWDSLYSRTASLIPSGMMDDVVIHECFNVAKSIKSLHPAQLIVLIVRQCLDPKRTVSAKLWGFNSRLTTANEIFEQLRVTCIAIDADSLSRNILQALYEGTPNVTRPLIPRN
ncbi:hypothetical protein T484DRAFT_1756145 [Baffinella frigidus]|nr:hypothetical protein T484DRAFT_1756145 [Cryptophyta sp. CCMP2293]